MADNKRWFKVWNSILTDPSFIDLPLDKIGQWTLLGALMCLHGENGKITITNSALSSLLRCKINGDFHLPNVDIDTPLDDNGKITVIMKNWGKYQLDSTGYERLKRFRKVHHDNGLREDKEKTKTKIKKSIGFIPPTIDLVQAYCQERNNDVDPHKWFSFYEAKGWMIGKNKMKDWKAAVRTWEQPTANTPLDKSKLPYNDPRKYEK